MKFHKLHGAGNDYVYVDTTEVDIGKLAEGDIPGLSVLVSDRHFGIGGDGLILISPSTVADAQMRIYNADGSEAEMCGNGIRAVAKYLFDHKRIGAKGTIETRAGKIGVEIVREEHGKARTVRVSMGRPRFTPSEIPTMLEAKKVTAGGRTLEAVVERPLVVGGETYEVTCVSMGNPHCVIWTPDVEAVDLAHVGSLIEHHGAFPARTNVEFVQVIAPDRLRQRTWERGSGETLACGTGASAVVVAATLAGLVDHRATVHLAGGELEIDWSGKDGQVRMTGPAAYVASGEVDLAELKANRRPR